MVALLQDVGSLLSFCSVGILLIGLLLLLLQRNRHSFLYYIVLLFTMEFAALSMSFNTLNSLWVLSFSTFLHFTFLVYWYAQYYNFLTPTRIWLMILISVALLGFNVYHNQSVDTYQSIDRIIYGLFIMLLSLFYAYKGLINSWEMDRSTLLFNISVLSYFSLDTFLAIGTNYFVNESIVLVAGFWFLRSIFLQFYYLCLINYTWRAGKTL